MLTNRGRISFPARRSLACIRGGWHATLTLVGSSSWVWKTTAKKQSKNSKVFVNYIIQSQIGIDNIQLLLLCSSHWTPRNYLIFIIHTIAAVPQNTIKYMYIGQKRTFHLHPFTVYIVEKAIALSCTKITRKLVWHWSIDFVFLPSLHFDHR